jgi:hypothetical protein
MHVAGKEKYVKRKQLISFLSLVILMALSPAALTASTWYVDGANGNDNNNCLSASTACKTIGHAISLAGSGDSILVTAGLYQEHLTIAVNVSLIGSGQGTIIDGQSTDRVVNISVATVVVTLSNLTIRNGMGNSGAGVLNYGTLTLNNTTITGNHAEYSGAGIYNSGTLQIINSTLSGNSVYGNCPGPCVIAGGGLYNQQGTVTIRNSTLNGNRAYHACTFPAKAACVSFGGAIFNGGTVILNNSTVAGNTAEAYGGYCYGSFYCIARGGGIWGGPSITIVSNSTLSMNSVVGKNGAFGGGVYVENAAIFQNSIVADNSSGGNCSGTVTSKGYNLSTDNSCNFTSAGDRNNTDPLLGPLQNNGGPTQTMTLLHGSPAIDGGNPAGCTDAQGHLLTTDQRGMPRPDKEDKVGCDIGAYESQTD